MSGAALSEWRRIGAALLADRRGCSAGVAEWRRINDGGRSMDE